MGVDVVPTPEVPPFDPEAYVNELSAYLFLERDPVPMSKVETVHPLPKGAEDLTLKQFVRKQNEFQLITVQGQVCVTNTPEHIKKQLKAGIEAPLEYWQSKAEEFKRRAWDLGCPLFDETAKANDYRALPEWAEVGVLQPSSKPEGDNFFINTHEPFCGVTIGVQGAGKSHTTNVIIENCMINHARNELNTPMSTVVFHYDECPDRNCENVTLTIPVEENGQAVDSIVILCSPSNFKRRKKAYRRIPNCTVHPLLFDFEQLSSSHLKKMMGVGHNDNQLYMQKIITDLRQWEKMGASARSYKDFKRYITERNEFASGQSLPLNQRLEMLESFLWSSPENQGLAQMCEHKSPADYFKPGTLVVVDLVDPFIDQRAANNIFQVILSMYIEKDLPCGKLTVFDEAHKYMDASVGNLCHDIVRLVRQMRHYGIRTLVSTQNPTVLHSELLELCSFAFLHRFHSPDWFKWLQAKLQLPKDSVPIISNLKTGEAIVYSSRSVFSKPSPSAVVGANLYRVLVKERVTRDCGATTLNAPAPTAVAAAPTAVCSSVQPLAGPPGLLPGWTEK